MGRVSLNRRSFTLGAAAATATALISPGDALEQAQQTPESTENKGEAGLRAEPPAPGASVISAEANLPSGLEQSDKNYEHKFQTAMAKLSPAARAEVQAKIASIFRKYGDHLSDEQKADIRRAMAETQDGLEKMRTFALENGDQPATVFKIRAEKGNR
jgi:hypothetical protein